MGSTEYNGDVTTAPEPVRILEVLQVTDGQEYELRLPGEDWPVAELSQWTSKYSRKTRLNDPKADAERLAACWNALQGIEDPSAVTALIAAAVEVFGNAEDQGETRGQNDAADNGTGALYGDWRKLADALVRIGMLDAEVLEPVPPKPLRDDSAEATRLARKRTIPALVAFRVGRYGPTVDPRGAQVVYDGHPWDVTGAGYREVPPMYYLDLRSFDRSKTVQAPMSQCHVLIREYDKPEE